MKEDLKFLQFLAVKIQDQRRFNDNMVRYNCYLNNYRFFYKRFVRIYNKKPNITISKEWQQVHRKIGKPYLGTTKINMKQLKGYHFNWLNFSWNF